MQQALESNRDLRVAFARFKAARALRDDAANNQLPTFTALAGGEFGKAQVLAQKSQQVLAGEESAVLMEPTCSPSPTRRGVEPAEANAIIERILKQAGHLRQRADTRSAA